MTSPPLHIPARGTVVLAPSVRIFFSATIVVIGTAAAAMFLKNPVQPQAVSSEFRTEQIQPAPTVAIETKKMPVPTASAVLPQTDSGSGKIGQVYQAPVLSELPAAIPVTVPEAVPVESNEIAAVSSSTSERKVFAEVSSDFKTIHTIPKPPKNNDDEPFKKIEDRMKAPSMSELNDDMLTMFQFADNLQSTTETKNSLPSDPFLNASSPNAETVSVLKPLLQREAVQSAENGNPLHPLVKKETLFDLKPIRKVD